MIALQPGLYLRVEQLDGPRAPQPLPLPNGFGPETAYLALGLYSPSETSEAYVVLSNDRDEVWFISNRHLRTVALRPQSTALRLPLDALRPAEPSGDGQRSGTPALRAAR
jgi:hypothetical protein